MKLPNFLIIGAPKSGTTSLYHYASQHPQVFMSEVKEPNFFALENDPIDFAGPWDREWFRTFAVRTRDEYGRLFGDADDYLAVGEASPMYLYHASAPERISQYIPSVKLIAILRNPVDRAYSAYLHKVREGREPLLDFAQALADEERRVEANWEGFWHYRRCGLYAQQLARYHRHFSADQLRVYTFDDFVRDPKWVVTDMFEFLDVDPSFQPDIRKSYNEAALPRSRMFNRVIAPETKLKHAIRPLVPSRVRTKLSDRLRKMNLSHDVPPMGEDVRRELTAYYRPDVLELQEILRRDLSMWMN